MKAITFVAALLCFVGISATFESAGIAEQGIFKLWMNTHNKVYADESELAKRSAIFSDNLAYIKNHNEKYQNGEVSYKLGPTIFADLTNEEYQATYLRKLDNRRGYMATTTFEPTVSVEDVPDSWDWRDANVSVVTPVKNQGSCGSCWAFSAVATMEGRYAQDSNNLTSFSEQD